VNEDVSTVMPPAMETDCLMSRLVCWFNEDKTNSIDDVEEDVYGISITVPSSGRITPLKSQQKREEKKKNSRRV